MVSTYSEYNTALLCNIVNSSSDVKILVFCTLHFIIILNVKEKPFYQRFLHFAILHNLLYDFITHANAFAVLSSGSLK